MEGLKPIAPYHNGHLQLPPNQQRLVTHGCSVIIRSYLTGLTKRVTTIPSTDDAHSITTVL
jgi:hypothetical protein